MARLSQRDGDDCTYCAMPCFPDLLCQILMPCYCQCHCYSTPTSLAQPNCNNADIVFTISLALPCPCPTLASGRSSYKRWMTLDISIHLPSYSADHECTSSAPVMPGTLLLQSRQNPIASVTSPGVNGVTLPYFMWGSDLVSGPQRRARQDLGVRMAPFMPSPVLILRSTLETGRIRRTHVERITPGPQTVVEDCLHSKRTSQTNSNPCTTSS